MFNRKTDKSQLSGNKVQIGMQVLEVKRLDPTHGLQLLMIGAPIWAKFKHGMSQSDMALIEEADAVALLEVVSACTGREAWWLRENATLPQLAAALLKAEELNDFTAAFEYVRQLGWAEEAEKSAE